MKSILSHVLVTLVSLVMFAATASAHCEIPCGIYDDPTRITLLREHISTIEKSMGMITDLEMEKKHNSNQLVRWVTNKEEHANKLQEIVTQYFMTQRIKVDAKNYDQMIKLLHQMLVASMKCKQTTDLAYVEELKTLVTNFEKLYFEAH